MKRTLICIAIVALAATGCGGSSKKAADKVSSSPSASPTSDAGSTTGVVPPGSGLSAACLKAAEEFSKSSQAFSTAAGQTDLSAVFSALGKTLKNLKGSVSSSKVKDALGTLADAYASAGEKLKGIHYTPGSGAPPAAYLDAIKSFDDPKFAAAGTVLRDYFGTSCKG